MFQTSTGSTRQVAELSNSNLSTLLTKCYKHWLWFLLSVSAMLLASYVYLARTQPVYRIQASLLVQDEAKTNEQDNLLKEFQVSIPKKVVENEIEIIRSVPLLERVVNRLHLNAQYFRHTTLGKQEIYGEAPVNLIVEEGKPLLYEEPLSLIVEDNQFVRVNGSTYPLNQRVQTPYGQLRLISNKQNSLINEPVLIKVAKTSTVVSGVLDALKVEPTSKTSSVIVLKLDDVLPARGEAILNQIIEEYHQAGVRDKNKMAANTLDFIEERLHIVSGELNAVEKNVEFYKTSNGITDLGTEAKSFLEIAKQNDALLNQVNVQLATLNDLQNYVTNQTDKNTSAPATVGLNDPTLIDLISSLTQLELQREQVSRMASEKSPLLQTVDNQIKTTKSKLADNILTMKSMLLSSQQQYAIKDRQLAGQIRNIPQKERSLMNITRQQTIKNNLYTYLLQKREETAVSLASIMPDSRTINPAQSSTLPVKPAKMTIYALFGMLGLLLPVVAIAGKSALSNKIVRRIDVEGATEAPILSEIVRIQQKNMVVVTPKSQTLVAEQIHTLRANLHYLRNGSTESQVLLFTSSISGEGKSFISLNLGLSLSMINKPTVIIDMDLRRPKLHKVFKIDSQPGVSEYLQDKADLEDILRPVPGTSDCFIIPCGNLPSNPTELLNRPALNHLIGLLRNRFEFIIIDSPPVGLVSDARMIASLANATFFIVRHEVTPKNYLKLIDKFYQDQQFQQLNIILNATDGSAAYYYSSGYKSNYAYNPAPKNWRFS